MYRYNQTDFLERILRSDVWLVNSIVVTFLALMAAIRIHQNLSFSCQTFGTFLLVKIQVY